MAANATRIQYAFSDARDSRGWDARVRRVNWTFDGELSAIAIDAWTLEETADALVLRWSVPQDRAGASFRIWREEVGLVEPGAVPGPDAVPIVMESIGPVSPGGTDYIHHDLTAERGRRLAYWIQDGAGEFAGPWLGMRGGPADRPRLRVLGNPFVTSARLVWSAPSGTQVDISIYDAAGRRIRDLPANPPSAVVSPSMMRGEVVWDGRDQQGRSVPGGVYWARQITRPHGDEQSVRLLRLR